MTAAVLAPAVRVPQARTSVRQLAVIEAKRYAKHPLFLVGALLCAALSIGLPGPDEIDYHVIPSFFLGVLGLVVAARLTTSTERSAQVVDAAPVPATRRTAALCLACAVPTVTGLAIVLLHRATMVADPIPEFRYGTLGSFDREVITLVVPVIACAGGPLLGVAVGRWLRFPGAALLAMVGLLVWSNISGYVPGQSSMDPSTLAARVLHVVTPYTAFGSVNGDNVKATTVTTTFTGSPGWWAVWTVALCGLAVCAALWRDAEGKVRRAVSRAFVAIGAVALVAVVLAVANGNQTNYETDSIGISTVALGAGHAGHGA
jgi:hypothetical protein